MGLAALSRNFFPVLKKLWRRRVFTGATTDSEWIASAAGQRREPYFYITEMIAASFPFVKKLFARTAAARRNDKAAP